MKAAVLGAQLYRHLPIAGVGNEGRSALELAAILGLHRRTIQRHLVELEKAGLAFRVTRDPDVWRRYVT